jgi:fatty acid synthase
MSVVRKTRRVICENPEDEIVISGISGRFPNSANVAEFAHNLYNKIDMVDDSGENCENIKKLKCFLKI